MSVVGWDPARITALRAASQTIADDLRAAATEATHRSGSEPLVDDIARSLARCATTWRRDLLPTVDRALHSSFAADTAERLRRWRDTHIAVVVPWAASAARTAVVPTLLLRQVEQRGPAAAAAVLREVADDPGMLFDAGADADTVRRIVRHGSAALDAEAAATVIRSVVGWFREYAATHAPADHGHLDRWPELLVDLIAPWLVHFSPIDTTWSSIGAAERRDLLRFVLADADALVRLVARTDELLWRASRMLARHGAAAIDVVGSLLGLIGGVVVQRAVDAEAQRLTAWRSLWTLATLGAQAAATLAGFGVGRSLLVSAASGAVHRATAGLRPDPAQVELDAVFAQRWSLTVAVATLVTSLAAQWSSSGLIDIDTSSSGLIDIDTSSSGLIDIDTSSSGLIDIDTSTRVAPVPQPDATASDPLADYVRRIAEWRARLPGGDDGALADRLSRLVSGVIANAEAGRQLAMAG